METNLCHLGVGDEPTLVSLENVGGGCRVNVYRTRTSVEPVGASRGRGSVSHVIAAWQLAKKEFTHGH